MDHLKALIIKSFRVFIEGCGRGGVVNLNVSPDHGKLNKNSCNFAVHGPILTKLHRFHEGPALTTSIWRFVLIVIVSPSGKRKCHVLFFEALLSGG